jgi:hypothetical protein
MLTIRKEQQQTLSEYMRKSFEDRMFRQLAADHPEQFKQMGEPKVRLLVHDGVDKAAGYGVTEERDVAAYVGLMLTRGSDWDKAPENRWATYFLTDKSLSGHAKMTFIREHMDNQ